MPNFPENLLQKLETRKLQNSFRELKPATNLIDFSSNDYLGFSKNETIFDQTHAFLLSEKNKKNGATGSRLLTGNHDLYAIAENKIAKFHASQTALIFNSGYDANIGFFSSLPQKNDFIIFDELCHASIRDGIKLSAAKSYKFIHNDIEDLERLLEFCNKTNPKSTIYIATESTFSMDGDSPDLQKISELSEKFKALLVVDEAHSVGVFGDNGEGLLQNLKLENKVFARIITFGKGLGCHGAAILGNDNLKNFLINFARSFIYTTALSPHAVANILMAYICLENNKNELLKLQENIAFFNQQKNFLSLKPIFVRSKSAIQSAIIPGNDNVKLIASTLQKNGFDVRAILSPTVPVGQERLRICLHSFNKKEEIEALLNCFSAEILKL